MIAILYSIAVPVGLSLLAALILYYVSRKFYVFEDPRIDEVTEVLPGANCGGCGFAGCRAFAETLVKAKEIGDLYCPVGGNSVMSQAATLLGKAAAAKAPLVAVVRCSGSFANRPRTAQWDGIASCASQHALCIGDTDCPNGCLGCGDCVAVCAFDAIHMDPETGLPVVDDNKCTACGACVKACPRNIIELRKKFPKNRKVFVSCMNKEKGGVARKYCSVACIGCSKCFKVCNFDAITIVDNLAFIDSRKCTLCRKCVTECPTNAILEPNFPPKKASAASETAAVTES